MSDQVAVMYNGTIVEQGPSEKVFGAPAHPYTLLLLDSVPSLTTFKQAAPLDSIVIHQEKPRPLQPDHAPNETGKEAQGCPFAPRCAQALEQCRNQLPNFTSLTERNDSFSPSTDHAPDHADTGTQDSDTHKVRCFLAQ